jgi:hypothetical protein
MKTIFTLLLFSTISLTAFPQKTDYSQTFNSVEKAKLFFEKYDDEYNKAMAEKDSIFFARHLADTYFNCTPQGLINNKKDEIRTLLGLPFSKVERIATKSEIFTYSGNLATFSVIKKLTNEKNSLVTYVRRTTVYQIIDGRWQSVSGQGTNVPMENLAVK